MLGIENGVITRLTNDLYIGGYYSNFTNKRGRFLEPLPGTNTKQFQEFKDKRLLQKEHDIEMADYNDTQRRMGNRDK